MIPSPLEDTAAIVTAATPDELWRWLVLHPHLRAFFNPFEAVVAWRSLHRDRPDGALQTAALLCTDHRWRRVTTPLVAAIEDSGLLTDSDLDELAAGFLWQDRYLWPVPSAWISDGTVTVDEQDLPDDRPVHLDRPIAPALRRWAAARIARRHPQRSHEILTRTGELDARAGDAVLVGLLDAAERYPGDARDALIDLGCSWSGGTVRLRAFQLLAARDGPQAAARRAAGDPNVNVRKWGAKLLRPPKIRKATVPPPRTDTAEYPPKDGSVEQPSLFG